MLKYYVCLLFSTIYLVTQQELTRQRQDFWATRVDGSQHMWQSIRTASESLLSGDIDLSRAILEVRNIYIYVNIE